MVILELIHAIKALTSGKGVFIRFKANGLRVLW